MLALPSLKRDGERQAALFGSLAGNAGRTLGRLTDGLHALEIWNRYPHRANGRSP